MSGRDGGGGGEEGEEEQEEKEEEEEEKEEEEEEGMHRIKTDKEKDYCYRLHNNIID